jgi:hypothetical protein
VVHQFARGNAQVDGERSHGHAENAVAESGEALNALAGNAVVGGDHFVVRKRRRSLEGRGGIMKGNFLLRRRVCRRGRGRETDRPCVRKLKPAPLKTKGAAPGEGNAKGGGRWR